MIYIITNIAHDTSTLDHFINWYRDIGVDKIIFNVHKRLLKNVKEKIRKYSDFCEINSILIDQYNCIDQHRTREQTHFDYLKNDDWVLYPDLDEFQEYSNIHEILSKNKNMILGTTIDRHAESGEFRSIVTNKNIFEQFPLSSNFTCKNLGVPRRKICAVRGYVLWRKSLFISKKKRLKSLKLNNNLINIYHFKWKEGVLRDNNDRINRYKKMNHPSLQYSIKKYSKIEKFVDKNKLDLSKIEVW